MRWKHAARRSWPDEQWRRHHGRPCRPAQGHQGNLEFNVSALASDISARVAQFENLLDTRVEAAANRVTTSGQHAADVIGSRSDELALTIKSRSGKPSGC
jgi:hypothetical protein